MSEWLQVEYQPPNPEVYSHLRIYVVDVNAALQMVMGVFGPPNNLLPYPVNKMRMLTYRMEAIRPQFEERV